jgi:polysaccharide biosynthesis protein PslH
MKILMGVPWIPYPPTDGGRFRSYYFIREASRRHTVSLFCIKNPSDDVRGLAELKRWCKNIHCAPSAIRYSAISKWLSIFNALPFGSAKLDDQTERSLLNFCEGEEFDLLHLQGMEFMGYLEKLNQGKPLLLDMVDCNSSNYLRRSQWTRHPVRRIWYLLQYQKFLRSEKKVRSLPLSVLLTSHVDSELLYQPGCHTHFRDFILPDGIDVELPFYRREEAEPRSLVFTGNMSYYPNEDAVRFFCKQILPMIQEHVPQVRLDVLGKNPSLGLVQFAQRSRHVSILGFVNNLRGELVKRSIYVCPLRMGTGVKVKLLEAMSAGMPVIATPISVEGLEVENGKHLLIASSPKEFAEKVLLALSSPELCYEMGNLARMRIQERYSWEKIGQDLDRIYNEVAGDHSPRKDAA